MCKYGAGESDSKIISPITMIEFHGLKNNSCIQLKGLVTTDTELESVLEKQFTSRGVKLQSGTCLDAGFHNQLDSFAGSAGGLQATVWIQWLNYNSYNKEDL